MPNLLSHRRLFSRCLATLALIALGAGLSGCAGMSDTIAGQNRRVVDMNDGQILSFGPTTGAILRSLADAVYAPAELRP